MKRLTKSELSEILEKHCKWLRDEVGGERADLRSADLSDADSSQFTIQGLRYHVCAFYRKNLNDVMFFIGCKTMTLTEMKGRTLETEFESDGEEAVKFMAQWK